MIRKILKKVFLSMPKKYIMFESRPDYSDNTVAVYNYMKDNGLFKKCKPVWYLRDKNNKKKNEKSLFVDGSVFGELQNVYYKCRSHVLVYCNMELSKIRNDQKSIYLCHGSKSKNTRGKYGMSPELDYILIQADMFKEAAKCGYSLSDHTEMITLGYPRNDDLLKENDIDRQKLFAKKFKKLIIWYPTFRQLDNGKRDVSSITLPVIHDEAAARIINEKAKELGILIVLKPHFAQDVRYIRDQGFSNILIINDEFLKDNNIRSYQLLSLSDSLLTDYSSVYYDYLLRDKPIGLVWEDYEEYKAGQGFALDPDVVYSGGEKIFDVEDFCSYLERIAKGEDILKEERTNIKNLSNTYQDADSSKRVAEFIVNLIKSN